MEDKKLNSSASKQSQPNQSSPQEHLCQIYGPLGSKYILIQKIGKGYSSHVFLAKKTLECSIQGEDCVAIKLCRRNYNQKMFSEEGIILKKLPSNPYIIKIFESGKALLTKKKSSKTRNAAYHVLEYLENGVLFDYIHFKNNISKGFGEKLGRIIFYELLLGVEYCHNNFIAHRDIKIENILLTSDFQIKLADFGFATEEFTNQTFNKPKFSFYGTDSYFPPEVFISNSTKSIDPFQTDLFALGVCLFYIVCGFKPFASAKRNDLSYKKILRRNYDSFWNDILTKTGELSKNFKEIVNKMLASNIDERFTSVDQIKKDKWILEAGLDDEVEFNNWKKVLASELENRKKFIFS